VALGPAARNETSREGAVGGCQPELVCGGELVNKGTRVKFVSSGAEQNSGRMRVSGQSMALDQRWLTGCGCIVSALRKAESSLGFMSRPGIRAG